MSRAALLLLLLALGACDDAFDPRAEGGPAFAVDGQFDGRTTRQVLRVQDLQDQILDAPDAFGGTVASTELASGVTTTWRDSLATLDDGSTAHLFRADLALATGQTHRVTVTADDGRTSSVTVDLPDPVATAGAVATSPVTTVRFRLDDVGARAEAALVRFRVRRTDGTGEQTFVAMASLQFEAGDATFLVFLSSAYIRARGLLYGESAGQPVFISAQLETVVASGAPAPVVGGVGGVGWTLPVVVPLPVPSQVLADVGFVDGR